MIEEKAEIADRMRKADGGSFPDLNKDGEVNAMFSKKRKMGVFSRGWRNRQSNVYVNGTIMNPNKKCFQTKRWKITIWILYLTKH